MVTFKDIHWIIRARRPKFPENRPKDKWLVLLKAIDSHQADWQEFDKEEDMHHQIMMWELEGRIFKAFSPEDQDRIISENKILDAMDEKGLTTREKIAKIRKPA
jgi:hypothetical protein